MIQVIQGKQDTDFARFFENYNLYHLPGEQVIQVIQIRMGFLFGVQQRPIATAGHRATVKSRAINKQAKGKAILTKTRRVPAAVAERGA